MDFEQLVTIAADLQCFSPGMVTAGEKLDQVRVQLSRWVRTGRVIRIHKGWYTLREPYRRVRIDLHVIACTIKAGTYVSLESALEFHGVIPEYVPETTCVTTGRPVTVHTPFGRIRYRHIKDDGFFGYSRHEAGVQHAHIATPEKALLDLLYLTPGSEDAAYLSELRLQNMEQFDLDEMRRMAERFRSPRLVRSALLLGELIGTGEIWV
jgi:predicted transcriptional regulator of viral defense system